MQSQLAGVSKSLLATIGGISSDFLIILAIVACLFIYGFFKGKDKITSVIFALYASAFIFTSSSLLNSFVPFKKNVSEMTLSKVIVFLILVIALQFVIGKALRNPYSHSKMKGIFENLLLSLSATGLLISIFIHAIPIEKFYKFSTVLISLFSSEIAFTIWLLLPIVAVFYAFRNHSMNF